jgi:uracil-DNA glycosylase
MVDDGSPRDVEALAAAISQCRICRDAPFKSPLPHEPRPIFQISGKARLVIASQAPGKRAHLSGIPFSDASGARLRQWLGLDAERFYDWDRVAIIPMGFCFPGYDAHNGDLPPRPECRLAWHERVFGAMPQVELILMIGTHSARYHLTRFGYRDLSVLKMSELMAKWEDPVGRPLPRLLPLPHPSWRNSGWLKRNPWFESDILPALRQEVRRLTA